MRKRVFESSRVVRVLQSPAVVTILSSNEGERDQVLGSMRLSYPEPNNMAKKGSGFTTILIMKGISQEDAEQSVSQVLRDAGFSTERSESKMDGEIKEGATFTCPHCGFRYELSAKTIGPGKDGTDQVQPNEPEVEEPQLPPPEDVAQPSPEAEMSPAIPKESRFGRAIDALLG